ncbi:MAG TPA: DEAD/DEAH box helicase [Candidatus Limnocylindrales bacterium]|nr:DEAD/DEAH box helicase [Candidatus Limnocylindrales bacterium]
MSSLLAAASTGYQLRVYQDNAVKRARMYLTDRRFTGRHGVIVAPTGSGKSLIIAAIATALDAPCIVFQPSREILAQNAEKLRGYGYAPEIFSASLNRKRIGAITLATIGSVVKHAAQFQAFRYVLIDECHLVNAKQGMYRQFLDGLQHARILGLTATPYRLASNALGSQLRFLTRTRPRVFQDVVQYTNLAPLFRAGFLAPIAYHREPLLDQAQLRLNSTGADYDNQAVQQHFAEIGFAARLRARVEQLLAEGHRNVLVFTRFTDEARALAQAIPGAAVVTADTPDHERAGILQGFRDGRIRVVTNVGVLTVGFDYPELTTVVLARPTMSLALYYQMVGRVLRPHPSKPTAHVVDLVDLVTRFGRIEDLHMQPGGPKGDQWVIVSNGVPLTNVYFGPPRGPATFRNAQEAPCTPSRS